jgi:hypothetical protein
MKHRIITHGGCTSLDGFSSAFIFKKYFCPILKIPSDIETIGINPYDVQTGKFQFEKGDIVLDLPKPNSEIYFWCDHHSSAKPKTKLTENHYWQETPSCAGLLIDIAVEKGLKLSKELTEFKNAIDKMDGALYTKDEIKLLYYPQDNYDNITTLQKVHIISSLTHTRDYLLNEGIFHELLSDPLGETPVSTDSFYNLRPLLFYKVMLKGYAEWREWVDQFIYFNEEAKCVVQDNRLSKQQRGNVDRFYSFMKFDKSAYSVNLKQVDEETARIGIGSNIFHKDRCKIDIGKICSEIGRKFGDGAGGGHYYVGGATIHSSNMDSALEYVLEKMK